MKATLMLTALILLASCANVYYTPEAKAIADTHSIFAIAPPRVSIAARPKDDPENIKELQRNESRNIQLEMYSWLLRRKSQGFIQPDVLDVETTNAILREAGYFDGKNFTPQEMAELLDVDGILTSNYALNRPLSTGAAIALEVLTNIDAAAKEATVTLTLYDQNERLSLWNYSDAIAGGVLSSHANMVDNILARATRKMPYRTERR